MKSDFLVIVIACSARLGAISAAVKHIGETGLGGDLGEMHRAGG